MPFTFAANSNLDLTDVALVKSYVGCGSSDTSRDSAIQLMVTSASVEFARVTGHVRDGQDPAKSPFVAPQTYDEWYDGNGNDTLYLRSWPIQSIALVQISGQTQTLSTDWNVPGYFVSSDHKAIVLRANVLRGPWAGSYVRGGCGAVFAAGTSNVHIQSTRGFNGVPIDVTKAVTQIVAANLGRTQMEATQSNSFSITGLGSGSMSFAAWTIPPQAQKVIDYYMVRSLA